MTDITPEALEERGFERDGSECWREFGRFMLQYKAGGRLPPVRILTGMSSVPLPGIRSLADVDAMIRFLEDGEITNESESR